MKKIKLKDLSHYEFTLRWIPLINLCVLLLNSANGRLFLFRLLPINEVYFLLAVIAILIALAQKSLNTNIILRTTKAGIITGTLITAEIIGLLFLSEYSPIATAVIIAVTFIAAFIFKRYILKRLLTEKPEGHKMKGCRARTDFLVKIMVCLIMFIPAVTGIYDVCSDNRPAKSGASGNDTAFTTANTGELSDITAITTKLKTWDNKNSYEKAVILADILKNEKEYLGINFDIELVISSAMPETTLGSFADEVRRIYINEDHLKNSDMADVLHTLIHEAHHAYAYSVISTLDFNSENVKNSFYFDTARKWKENSENYISGDVNFSAYKSQILELDANSYAAERLPFYIEDYTPVFG